MESTTRSFPSKLILVLNGIMGILPFVFYLVFTTQDIRVGDLDPIWMIYTGIAYIVSFAILLILISKRSMRGIRAIFVLNILIAIPAGAYIGMVIAIISLALSFFNQKFRSQFQDSR